MTTIDCETIDRQAIDCQTIAEAANAYATIDRLGRQRPFEVELLAAGGIEAEVAYEGDVRRCPYCLFLVLSDAPGAWAA